MNDRTDQLLLRDYARDRSEAAFAELVRRHIDLVYSAARRMVCDSHQADDVTQGVFVALAQNAGKLTDHPVLSGWLHRTTQNLAANAVRANVRRQTREQEAAAMNELIAAETDASWEQIAPHLDTALGELEEADRDAVLLRYFERKSAREMAQVLGISDEAAQKRVSRAVERLREFFAKRGVSIGAGGLVAVVSANAVQAAPVGLGLTSSAAAALTGTTLATTATATATKTIAMTALLKTIVTATIAVLAGAGIYEARQALQLRAQNRALQLQQAPLSEQIQRLNQAAIAASNQIVALRDENERLNRTTGELLKLRGEVGLLRTQNQTLTEALAKQPDSATPKKLNQGFGKLGEYLPAENATDAGDSTAEDFLQTFIWAMRENKIGRLEQIEAPLTGQREPGDVAGEITQSNMEAFKMIQNAFTNAAGFRLSAYANEDGRKYEVRLDTVPAQTNAFMKNFNMSFVLEQTSNGWRFGNPP